MALPSDPPASPRSPRARSSPTPAAYDLGGAPYGDNIGGIRTSSPLQPPSMGPDPVSAVPGPPLTAERPGPPSPPSSAADERRCSSQLAGGRPTVKGSLRSGLPRCWYVGRGILP